MAFKGQKLQQFHPNSAVELALFTLADRTDIMDMARQTSVSTLSDKRNLSLLQGDAD